jgi:hypothetical protein
MVCWGFCVGVQLFRNLYVKKIMVDYLSWESELELVPLACIHLDQLPGSAAMMMHYCFFLSTGRFSQIWLESKYQSI